METEGFACYYRADGGLRLRCIDLPEALKSMRPNELLEAVAMDYYACSIYDWDDETKKTFYIYDSEKDENPILKGDVVMELVPQFFVYKKG